MPKPATPKFGLGFGKLAVPDYGKIAAAAAMSGLAMATGDAGMMDPLHPVQTAQAVIDAGFSMPVQTGKPAPAIPDYSSIAAACAASAMYVQRTQPTTRTNASRQEFLLRCATSYIQSRPHIPSLCDRLFFSTPWRRPAMGKLAVDMNKFSGRRAAKVVA